MLNINITTGDEEMVNETMPTHPTDHDNGERRLNVMFTGHRAIAGNWCEDYTNMWGDQCWRLVVDKLVKFGDWIIAHGYEPKDVTFINGGALGFDLAAVFGLILPWQQKGAHFTLALPWPGYWNSKWDYRKHTANQIRAAYDRADSYLYAQQVDDGKWGKALNERNKVMVHQMVSEEDVCCAMWDGKESGGTWNCLQYIKEYRYNMHHPSFKVRTFNPLTGKWGIF